MHVRIELETELSKAEQNVHEREGINPPGNRGMQISSYLRYLNQETPDLS
jgi:hypothetical protein